MALLLVKVADTTDHEAVAVIIREGDMSYLQCLPPEIGEKVFRYIETAGYRGKKDTFFKLPLIEKTRMVYVLPVNCGKDGTINNDDIRLAAAKAVKEGKRDNVSDLALMAPDQPQFRITKALVEGSLLGAYRFDKYRRFGHDGEPDVKVVNIVSGDEQGVKEGIAAASAQNFARDLANEPGNVVTPEVLADVARDLAAKYAMECQVMDEEEIRRSGMNALWHVGKGSHHPPRFIHMSYRPQMGNGLRLALVGKGITFDSGGLDIKPGESMRSMKGDKSGAAAVLAVMQAVASYGCPIEVHGIIPAAENMPGGGAFRPDDIITAHNGKTVEVVSTDAEGRLALADGLSYASTLRPDIVIDIATLTGACAVALGEYTAGLFTNDEELQRDLMSASKACGERLWPLPLDDERLRKKIKTGNADLLNSGGRYGGAITAAMFLQEFVGDGIRWGHIDMAGTDYYKEEYGYYSKGASGFGARLLFEFVCRLSQKPGENR